jgi:phenylalanyl-tRNA synthetase beta chain
MKISYNWLKNYIALSVDPHQLADHLSLVGLEVEEVSERSFDFPRVVIGRVLVVEPHPRSDKLKICQVDIGDRELSIICGAPNVAGGQSVPVALEGASLPNGMKIQTNKIRGVTSEGMICSQAELSISEDADGIWVLADNLPLGERLDKALDLQRDYIFDLAITPNRPDCLSHIGVAREIGVLLSKPISVPKISMQESNRPADKEFKIAIETPHGCPRYSARLIKNVKIAESPAWLVRHLEAVGMRSINNVVDITNFVLMETGHPLHAFDFNLLKGQKIIVRESTEGEKFITLDDQERILKAGTVMICDAGRAVAIGGIMGGLNSEVNSDTTDILLESAYFNPESIQISSRYLALSTEASQRFERGADPNGNIYALDRATALIAEICGGEIYKGVVDAYPNIIPPSRISLDVNKINNLLGTRLSENEMIAILKKLGFQAQDNEIVVPTFRPDVSGVADLAEEVARHHGLDKISPKKVFQIDYQINMNRVDLLGDELRNILTGMGLQEVITNSMVNSEIWENLTGRKIYPLYNPISKDMNGMRNSMIPSLAQVIQYNRNRKYVNLKIFEINRVFLPRKGTQSQPEEILQLVIAISGKREGDLWFSSRQVNDFFDIKGIIEAIIHKISLDNWQFISYSDQVLGDMGLALQAYSETVGFFGLLSRQIQSQYDIEEDVYIAQLDIQKLLSHIQTHKKYRPIPKFPLVERDLALILDEGTPSDQLSHLIYKKGGRLLKDLEIFDVYQGKQIPAGKKSIAFHLTFQSMERTLTEEEVNDLMDKIYASVNKELGVKLRE